STAKKDTPETTIPIPIPQEPKETTHGQKSQELWSDEVERVVAETSTQKDRTQQEASKFIRIDDSDAEMEEMEADNNNWRTKTDEEQWTTL
ncbi:6062_t:CDS:1, partial [Acaulospora morrowiae]